MPSSVCPPRRMRFSFESRCRIVDLIVAGESPQGAAALCGASRATGYRLWRRFQQGGWPALRDRPSTPKRQPLRLSIEAEAEILRWREHLRDQLVRLWYGALRRRGQRHRLNWQRMRRYAERWLPPARITHPWPDQRFDARTQVRSPVR